MKKDNDALWILWMLIACGVVFFYIGLNNATENAMDAQLEHNRLMVYCQQPGRLETLCGVDNDAPEVSNYNGSPR